MHLPHVTLPTHLDGLLFKSCSGRLNNWTIRVTDGASVPYNGFNDKAWMGPRAAMQKLHHLFNASLFSVQYLQ